MSKQKVNPVNLNCKKIERGDIYHLIEKAASETELSINKVISEINKAIPEKTNPYDDTD